jgi:hypothetical protein
MVGFRFMSDWGTNGNGVLENPNFYVDNIAVDGTQVNDGSNAAAFKDVTFYNPIAVDFNLDLVSLPRVGATGNGFKVLHLMTRNRTETAKLSDIRRAIRNSNVLVLIVTYDAPQGVNDYAPYEVAFRHRH